MQEREDCKKERKVALVCDLKLWENIMQERHRDAPVFRRDIGAEVERESGRVWRTKAER